MKLQTHYLDCSIDTMELGIYHWVNIFIPDVGAMPEDSVGHLGQDGVGREEASDLRFDLRDLALQQLEILVEQGRPFRSLGWLFLLQHAFANVDELSAGSRPRPEIAPPSAWQAATGLRAECHEAGGQCGFDSVCLGQSSPDFPERLDLCRRELPRWDFGRLQVRKNAIRGRP